MTPLLPFDDATPRPGQDNGASAENQDTASDLTRLPLSPPVRCDAPETSRLAARRVAGHAGQQRADVLAVIVKAAAHGATDAEIELATGFRAQSVSPRRGELRKMGLIVYSGRQRPTPRGNPAMVWVLAEFAPKPEGTVKP